MAARNRFASPALQAEATRENADLLWVTRAIIDDPSDHLPPPNAKDLAVNEEILDVDAWNLGTDHLCAYSDGSCTQELSREMKRASWGIIFYNSSNKATARYYGASAAGEFAGLELALEVAVDCKAVNHVWHLPLQKQLAANHVYAGVLLSSYRDPNRPNVKQVKWVSSHRTLDQARCEERQEIQRNDGVDALVGVKDTSERSDSMQLVIGLVFPLFCQRGRASFVVRGSATWVCASAVVSTQWHFISR